MHNNTILLVEDDRNDVLLIQRAFRKANITSPIQNVVNGEEAIAYLTHQEPFDDEAKYSIPVVILLDLKLPIMSGLEFLEWLRQQSGLNRIPVVVLTSSKESVDINKAYDLGANSYLLKPVAFESLQRLVEQLNLYWITLNERPMIT